MPPLDDLKFGITIDNRQAIAAISETQAKMGGMSQGAAQAAGLVGKSFNDGIVRPSGSARLAIVGMTQALSDSQMFMVNFRMGMMSIGNNIDFVTQALVRVKEEASERGQSMWKALSASITPATGVMIGVNALVLGLQVLPGLFAKASAAATKAAEEGLKVFDERIKGITDKKGAIGLESELSVVQAEIKRLNDLKNALPEEYKTVMTRDGAMRMPNTAFTENDRIKRDSYNKDLEFWNEYVKKNKEALEAEDARVRVQQLIASRLGEEKESLGKIEQIQKNIKDLTEQRDKSNDTAFINSMNIRIDKLKTELELLTNINKARNTKIAPVPTGGLELYDKKEISKDIKRAQEQAGRYEPLLYGKVPGLDQRSQDKVDVATEATKASRADVIRDISQASEFGRAAINSLGQSVQSQIGGAFERAFGNANSFLASFAKNFLSTMADLGSKKLLTSLIDLIPGAGAFFNLLPHADGTIITSPIVGVDGSGVGHLFGEKGPEAVIPLSRLAQFMPDMKATSSLPQRSNSVIVNKIYITSETDWNKYSKGQEQYNRRYAEVTL